MEPKKLSYKEIKARQQADLRSKRINIDIYRNFSTPFTYIFVKLGISPNTITILSFFLCIFGAFFLSIGTYLSLIIGAFFFLVFRVFDDADGEVARIQNSQSIEGVYFDRISHYIFSFCLGAGLGLGLYRLYNNYIYIVLGLILIFVLILENAIMDSVRSVLRKEIINKILNKNIKSDSYFQKKIINKINNGRSFSKQNIFSKLFSIYPLQGLVYSDYFIGPLLMVLILIELSLYFYFNLKIVLFNLTFGIISIYILIICISKLIWITKFIHKMKKNSFITKFLEEIKH